MTDPIAAYDQTLRGVEDMGTMIATFFNSMIAEGMERHEALECVLEYQRGQAMIAAHIDPHEGEL